MAEEQKWQEQGSHTLCANNCGFFGCPTTLNMCSKCYKDHCLKEGQMKNAQLVVEKTLTQAKSSSIDSSSSSSAEIKLQDTRVESNKAVVGEEGATQPTNRCATCRRRVGITGFKCRCGITFCGTHRYPEQHGCTFDYKAMGREAIAKANPVVKAEKLDKI